MVDERLIEVGELWVRQFQHLFLVICFDQRIQMWILVHINGVLDLPIFEKIVEILIGLNQFVNFNLEHLILK